MKKIYTSVLMFVAVIASAVGQNNQNLPEKTLNVEKNNETQRASSNQVTSLSSRGNALWANGFETPSEWVIANEVGNSDNWVIGTGGPSGSFAIDAITSTGGGNFAMFDSDLLCSGNQLANITTANSIDLSASGGVVLEFEQYYRKFADLTYVQVSNDGVNWTSFEVNAELSNNDFCDGNPNLAQVNIASVTAGQATVWIRFQFYSPSNYIPPAGAVGCAYAWMIDDVALYEAPANDLVMQKVISGDIINDYAYSKVPVTQATEVIVGAVVLNFGTAAQSNVSLDWEVTLGGTSVATGTEAASASLASGDVDTVWISTGYTPDAVGELVVTVTASADESEDVPANNEGAGGYEITDYVWGHDYEDQDYFLLGYEASEPDGSSGFEMGADYFPQMDGDVIYALQFALGSSTTSSSVIAKVYEDDPANGPVSETVYDIQPGDIPTGQINFITVVLDEPVAMNAGSLYTATVEISAGDDGFILGNTIDDGDGGQSLYLGGDGTWYNWIGLTTSMRLNLDETIGIEENEDVTGVYMYPNPATDNFTVGFVAKEDQDMTVNILGSNGALVLSEQVVAKVGQSSTVTFNVDGLASGIYMVQLQGAKSTLTQRIVVQ
ncbi:MAG: hypothetical protein RL266_2197 [Bacteroidota bacterium]|jgi:hypothetical protein